MINHPVNKLRGFTVTELLAAVAILLALALLILLKAPAAKAKVRSTACKNLLRQIGNGLHLYVHDNGYYPPLTDASTNVICFDRLYPYYPLGWTSSVWNCPDYVAKNGIISRDLLVKHSLGISYGYNYLGVTVWPGCPEPFRQLRLGLGHLPENSQKEGGVSVPSEMYAVADARSEVSGQEMAGCIKMSPWFLHDEGPPPHASGYNVLFCDGHVTLIDRKDYLYPPRTASNWNSDHQPHQEAWAPLTMWAVKK